MSDQSAMLPALTVWDLPRGTIRQFARALAAVPGALSELDFCEELLTLFWRGEFEREGQCLTYFAERTSQSRAGGFIGSDVRLKRSEKRIRPIKRDELRKILNSAALRVPSFEVLVELPLSFFPEIGTITRESYPDQILIDTSGVRTWVEQKRTAKCRGAAPSTADDKTQPRAYQGKRGGRRVWKLPERYDRILEHVTSLISAKGKPDVTHQDWKQKHLEKKILDFCGENFGDTPSIGWARQQAPILINMALQRISRSS